MHSLTASLVAAACVPLAVTACAAGSADQPGEDMVVIEIPTRVYVTNNHQLDVRVFAFNESQSIPLGSVSSFTTETFQLPNAILMRGRVRIVADPIGAVTAYLTDVITFGPGQDIEVIVQNNLQLSTYSLR
jgi:hypothetical protein